MSARTGVYVLAWLVVSSTAAGAQERPLSLSEALALAREQSPLVTSARARVAEAEAARVAASVRLDNPEIDAAAGPRFSDPGRQLDFGIGVSQMFETGARRRARRSAAAEGVAAAEAGLLAAQREAVRQAAIAFLEAQYHQRHVAYLDDAVTLAADVEQVAERRFALGDVAALDVNTARVERARLESERAAVGAERLIALGTLGEVLGATTVPSVSDEPDEPRTPALDDLLRAIDLRPELRAIDAEIRQAEARLRLAAAMRRPQFGVNARYDRDEGDHVLLGGLVVTMPLFAKGQDVNAEAAAAIAALRTERAVLTNTWSVAIRARLQALDAQRRALQVIERDALPAAIDNETLARRSYESGQISIVDWMVLRREALQVRRERLERLRQIAVATVHLEAVAGVMR